MTPKKAGTEGQMRVKALEGIRIITVEDFLALPFATMLLADLGAEVIRVQSHTRMIPWTMGPFPDSQPGPRYWDHNGTYDGWYRNKKSLTLDFAKPKGVQLFKELVATADIVMENNRPGVMKKFGLDYEALRQVKPDIIVITSSGYGHQGLWGNYGAFARAIDAMSGMSNACGYVGEGPVRTNASYMDTTTAWHNATAAMMALRYRRKTGRGQWIDHSMYETGVACIGQMILDYQVNGRTDHRIGNHHSVWAPHGCYRCAGNDEWVVIATTDEDEWKTLCRTMGRPELATDERFATPMARYDNQDALNAVIAEWTKPQDRHKVADLLQKAGVPAGAVNRIDDIFKDPHFKERGFIQWYSRPDAKEMGDALSRPYFGWPFKMSKTQPSIESIPNLGQHNEYVLGTILGKSEAEIAQLYQEGVIAKEPVDAEQMRPKPSKPGTEVGRGGLYKWDQDYKKVLGLKY